MISATRQIATMAVQNAQPIIHSLGAKPSLFPAGTIILNNLFIVPFFMGWNSSRDGTRTRICSLAGLRAAFTILCYTAMCKSPLSHSLAGGQYSIQCISFDLSLTALYSSVTPGTRAHVSIVSPRLAAPVGASFDGPLVRLRYLLPLTIRRKPHSRIASRPAMYCLRVAAAKPCRF